MQEHHILPQRNTSAVFCLDSSVPQKISGRCTHARNLLNILPQCQHAECRSQHKPKLEIADVHDGRSSTCHSIAKGILWKADNGKAGMHGQSYLFMLRPLRVLCHRFHVVEQCHCNRAHALVLGV